MPKSAEISDIGDVFGDVDSRSVVTVDKTQPVFVISNSSGVGQTQYLVCVADFKTN